MAAVRAEEEAAARETLEEANLVVDRLSLLGVYTRQGPGVLIVVFEARALGEAPPGGGLTAMAGPGR